MHVWRVLFCLVLCFLFVSQSFCEEEYFLCLQILQREKCESKTVAAAGRFGLRMDYDQLGEGVRAHKWDPAPLFPQSIEHV